MDAHRQRLLPGFHPEYIRIDATQKPDGDWDVRVYGTSGPGFVSVADSDLYESLVGYEVLDVASAALTALLGL